MAQQCLNQERFPGVKENRTCKICKQEKDLVDNFLYHSASGYFSKTCMECTNIKRREEFKEKANKEGRVLDGTHTLERTKTCVKCNEKKLLQDNFPKLGKSYGTVCKKCVDILIGKNAPLVYSGSKITKICNLCKEEKSVEEFGKITTRHGKVSHRFCCKKCDNKIDRKTNRSSELYTQYRVSDIKKNLEFSLSKDYIEKSLQLPCTYCNHPSTGLDRKNNNLGHIEENCAPCCWECNTARMNNFTHEEMFELGAAIGRIKNNRKKE